MAGFPRKGAYRVTPERNLREDDDVANRVGLSQPEDRTPALSCELLQGRAQRGVVVPAGGTVSIAHKLGRQIVGWIVTRNGNTAGTGNTLPTEQASDENFLILGNPGGVDLRVNLWIY